MLAIQIIFYYLKTFYLIGLNWNYYLTSISGFSKIFIILLNSIIVLPGVFLPATVGIWGLIVFSFTIICFAKFKQLDSFSKKKNIYYSNQLEHFKRQHTGLLQLILLFNRKYGNQFLTLILLNVPLNTYLTLGLIDGKFTSLNSRFAFTNLVAGQYVALLFLHVLFARYSGKIHHCTKRLFHVKAAQSQVKRRNLLHLNLLARIRLACYIEKFNIKRKYGLTYSTFGLISMSAFTKVNFLDIYSYSPSVL